MIPEVLSFLRIMSAMYVCTSLFEDSKCLQTYTAAVSVYTESGRMKTDIYLIGLVESPQISRRFSNTFELTLKVCTSGCVYFAIFVENC